MQKGENVCADSCLMEISFLCRKSVELAIESTRYGIDHYT